MQRNIWLIFAVIFFVAACEAPPGAALKAAGTGWLDKPFPNSSIQLDNGSLDFSGFITGPDRTGELVDLLAVEKTGKGLVASFRDRTTDTVLGYGVNASLFFAAEATLALAPEKRYDSDSPNDGIVVYACRERCETYGFVMRYIAESNGDPYLPDHTVVISPREGHPWPSGSYVMVVVTDQLLDANDRTVSLAGSYEGLVRAAWSKELTRLHPDGVVLAFGVQTQDVLAELDRLRDAGAAWFQDNGLTIRNIREVKDLVYYVGESSPNREEVTIIEAHYSDGTTGYTEMELTGEDPYGIVVTFATAAYPFRGFEFEVTLPNYRNPAQAPYGSPGLEIVNDLALRQGLIRFEYGPDARPVLVSEPVGETVRLLVQLPVDAQGSFVPSPDFVVWEHGTGGSAYNAVHRVSMDTGNLEVSKVFGSENYAIIIREQPLFGQRYPLYDEGYNSYLGAYNIANITAFRDYVRQAAVETFIIGSWAHGSMASQLATAIKTLDPAATFKEGKAFVTAKPLKFGHSLGAQMGNISLAMHREIFPYNHGILSGAGGVYIFFGLETGLLDGLDEETKETIRGFLKLIKVDVTGELTPRKILGGVLGIGPDAQDRFSWWHPVSSLFQTLVDGGDPASFVPYLTTPETLITGVGDYQVPNVSTDWIAAGEAPMDLVLCKPARDNYDPHQCTYEEPEGNEAVRAAIQKGRR